MDIRRAWNSSIEFSRKMSICRWRYADHLCHLGTLSPPLSIRPVNGYNIKLIFHVHVRWLIGNLSANTTYLATVHVLYSSLAIKEIDVAGRGYGSHKRGVVEEAEVGALCANGLAVDQRICAREIGCRRCIQFAIWKLHDTPFKIRRRK